MQRLAEFCSIFTLSLKPQVLFNPSTEGPVAGQIKESVDIKSVQLQDKFDIPTRPPFQ